MKATLDGDRRLSCAQRALVRDHMRLVDLHLRKRVHMPYATHRNRERDDLYQEGCLGLIRAAMSYDDRRHGAFEPYALARIRAAVHTAIHERFATVRVPVGVLTRAKQARLAAGADADSAGPPSHHPFRRIDAEPDDLVRSGVRPVTAPPAAPGPDAAAHATDTIGHQLRDKHRIALDTAVRRVARRCRRSDVATVLAVIVSERLAIPNEHERTSLRAIGRRYGVSIGRTVAWQRDLERETRRLLEADPEFQRLRHAAQEQTDGYARPLDASMRRELAVLRRTVLRQVIASHRRRARALILGRVLRCARRPLGRHALAWFARLDASAQRQVLATLAR